MNASDKHQLEGLLQARSEVLRHRRQPRARASVEAPVLEVPLRARDLLPSAAAVRPCADCGEEIGTRRLRAMPDAERCLHCQRSAERQAAAT